MQQSNQESYPQTDEIDLRKFINSLVARKLLIFGFTAFVTLLAIIYALNLTPTYKTISSFTSPSDSSIINLNKLKLTNESKDSVFKSYLTHLSSKDLQTKIFLDGGYLTAFNPENNPIDDVNSFISSILDSVHLAPPEVTQKILNLGFLTEIPYSISMEGTNPELISRYLNELVTTTNDIVINKFSTLIKKKIDIRLEEISLERQLLLIQTKQQRLNEIEVLKYSAEIAKSLGIVENNFKLISDDVVNSNFTFALSTNYDLPQWYLYGERALNERIKLLKNRTNDKPFVDGFLKLDTEKRRLDSFVIDSFGLSSMQLNRAAKVPTSPIKPNKRMIVLLALIGGFMMSIFLALVMGALKPDEENST